MNMKIIRGTVFGGISFFFLGWLVWGILLAGVMANLMNTTLNRPATDMVWWAIIASNLVLALLVTLILKWYGAKSIVDGVQVGAIVGVLFALSYDLGMYSMTTMITNLAGVVVDALAYAVVTAITSLVIVLTWGKS